MNVRVRLFAGHRERAGASQIELTVPDGSDVGTVFQGLVARFPSLSETETFTTFARNRQVVDRSEPVADGDEIALLQPVSGG